MVGFTVELKDLKIHLQGHGFAGRLNYLKPFGNQHLLSILGYEDKMRLEV